MRLYACGFNAHNQLFPNHTEHDIPRDELSFRVLATTPPIRLLFAGWSATVIAARDKLSISGVAGSGRADIDGAPVEQIISVFGDHNGVLGALGSSGFVYSFGRNGDPEERFKLQPLVLEPEEAPTISHIALLGTGTVAVVLLTSPMRKASVSHVMTFSSFDAFKAWYRDPTADSHQPSAHHMIPSSAKQLLAANTFFVLLTDAGEIWTWADDARYSHCLARSTTQDSPAQKPGRVDELLWTRIKKVDAGGWVGAAVAETNDLYIWGGRPGSGLDGGNEDVAGIMSGFPPAGGGLELVDLAGGVDIVDVGVGAAHVVALDGRGRIWGVGAGENGQLSRGENVGFQKRWGLMKGLEGERVVGVAGGERSSFAWVEE